MCKAQSGNGSENFSSAPSWPFRISTLCSTNLGVPNGVFQTVFFRFLTSACDRCKLFQRDKECPQTPVFSGILVPSALADPDPDHPLNTPLWKTPFRKHRLLLLGLNPLWKPLKSLTISVRSFQRRCLFSHYPLSGEKKSRYMQRTVVGIPWSGARDDSGGESRDISDMPTLFFLCSSTPIGQNVHGTNGTFLGQCQTPP